MKPERNSITPFHEAIKSLKDKFDKHGKVKERNYPISIRAIDGYELCLVRLNRKSTVSKISLNIKGSKTPPQRLSVNFRLLCRHDINTYPCIVSQRPTKIKEKTKKPGVACGSCRRSCVAVSHKRPLLYLIEI